MKKERLKIAMISIHSSPMGDVGTRATGGMSIYLAQIARRLAAMDHLIDIFTRIQDGEGERTTRPFPNVRLIHLPAGPPHPLSQRALHDHLPEFFANLEQFKHNEGTQYDLVHSHYWLSGQIGQWAQRRWRIPHVFNYHTLALLKNRIAELEKEPDVRIILERQLAADSDLILAGTQREKRHIIECYGASPQTVRVVPCGVDLNLFRPPTGPSEPRLEVKGKERVILYVGRFDPVKGVDRLLASVAELRREIPLRLVLVGGGEEHSAEVKALRTLCSDLSVTDCIVFAGRQDHHDLPDFYRAADVLVLPSYYESFGLVLLEALACGTPVVSTRVGVVDDIVENGVNGWVVADNTPQQLAEGIRKSLQLRCQRRTARASVRATVQEYDWSLVAAAIDREYRSLLRCDDARCRSRAFSYCSACSKGMHSQVAYDSLRGCSS